MARKHHLASTIKKIRLAQTGKKNSFYGHSHSKKSRACIAAKLRGKKNPMYGKKHSLATRRKISLARRARLRNR